MVKANRYNATIVIDPAMSNMDYISVVTSIVRETVAKMLVHAMESCGLRGLT